MDFLFDRHAICREEENDDRKWRRGNMEVCTGSVRTRACLGAVNLQRATLGHMQNWQPRSAFNNPKVK